MKHLFNDYEAMGKDGNELSDRVESALWPILNEYQQNNYSMRDVGVIVNSAVSAMVAEMVLKAATKKRKQDRSEAVTK
jgi:hypothetical protein